MAGAGKKWLLGCGIGCGLLLLIVGVIGTVGYFGVRDIMDQAENIEDSFEDMESSYGQPEAFVPRADGTIPASRMETFLAVRDEMALPREELSDILAALDGDEESGESANWMTKVKAGVTLVPSLLAYGEQRNRVLLTNDMGLGEYLYIYDLAYYEFLDLSPADGPQFQITSDDNDDDEVIHWGPGNQDSGDVREQREKHVRESMNRLLVKMARNQLSALELADPTAQASLPTGWRDELATELAQMENESRRLLWEEGLPQQIRQSFEPYHGRLTESYDRLVNAIETSLTSTD